MDSAKAPTSVGAFAFSLSLCQTESNTICARLSLAHPVQTVMRKEIFVEDEYYHIYNRGVDKRIVFIDDRDRLRFLNTIYILNNFLNIPYRFDIYGLKPLEDLVSQKPLVRVLAGCLMPNHFHLFLSQLQDKGISKLLHKIGVSYSMYFNKRHERNGGLFERSFKAKLVDRDEYATYLTHYIHLNPMELFQTRSGTKKDDIIKMVKSYPWSSLPDYLGQKSKFTLLLDHGFRDEVLGMGADVYEKLLCETAETRF